MCGDLSALVKTTKEIHQNKLTHLCVALVNCLGDSDESPIICQFRGIMIYIRVFHSLYRVGINGKIGINRFNNSKKSCLYWGWT